MCVYGHGPSHHLWDLLYVGRSSFVAVYIINALLTVEYCVLGSQDLLILCDNWMTW